jgi:hypothetical protein
MSESWAVVVAAFIGLTASPLVTWLTSTIENRRSKQSAERDARYLAVRVAIILECFAIECAEQVSESSLHERSKGAAGSTYKTTPQLQQLPENAEWKLLEPNLLARVLSFQVELRLAEGTLTHMSAVEPDCTDLACRLQSGKCGYIAWQIAEDLRRYYSLPTFDPFHTAWDVVGALKVEHDEVMDFNRRAKTKAA